MFKALSNYSKSLPGPFWLLAGGRFVSILGNQLSQSTLVVFFTFVLDSARFVSWLQIVAAVLSVATLPFGGVMSDKKDRIQIMIWTDMGNTLLIAGIGLMILFRDSFPSQEVFIAIIFASVGLQAVCHSIFMPAAEAIVPDLLENHDLRLGQQHLVTQNQAAQVLGRALSGLLYKLLGPAPLMFLNAASYAVSAFFSSRIRVPPRPRSISTGKPSFVTLLYEGMSLVRTDRDIRILFLLSSVVVFFFAPLLMVSPFYIKRQILGNEVELGYFMAALTLGSVLGPSFQSKIARWLRLSDDGLLVVLFLLKGLFLAAVFAFESYALALIGIFLAGFCSAALSVAIIVRIQKKCPSSHLGRVMSLLYAAANLFQPMSVYACGVAIDREWMLPSELGLWLSALVTFVPILMVWRNRATQV